MRSYRLFLRLTYFTEHKALKVRGVITKGRMSCFGGKCPVGLSYFPRPRSPQWTLGLFRWLLGRVQQRTWGRTRVLEVVTSFHFHAQKWGWWVTGCRKAHPRRRQLQHHAPHPTAAQASGADVISGLPWVTRWRRGAWDAQDRARVISNSGDFNGEL